MKSRNEVISQVIAFVTNAEDDLPGVADEIVEMSPQEAKRTLMAAISLCAGFRKHLGDYRFDQILQSIGLAAYGKEDPE